MSETSPSVSDFSADDSAFALTHSSFSISLSSVWVLTFSSFLFSFPLFLFFFCFAYEFPNNQESPLAPQQVVYGIIYFGSNRSVRTCFFLDFFSFSDAPLLAFCSLPASHASSSSRISSSCLFHAIASWYATSILVLHFSERLQCDT